MDNNPIKVIDRVNTFPNLTQLKEISMCYMQSLTTIENGGMSGLTNLESLYVQNCPKLEKISDYAMSYKVHRGRALTESAIRSRRKNYVESRHENYYDLQTFEGEMWPPLKKLDISDNALRYLPSMLVGRWDGLEELDLMNNEWSCDCNNQFLVSCGNHTRDACALARSRERTIGKGDFYNVKALARSSRTSELSTTTHK